VAESFSEGHQLLGIHGLALLRSGAERRFAGVEERTAEMAEILERLESPDFTRRDLPTKEVGAGYADWAHTYDQQPDNDTIAAEEPIVRALLDGLAPGPVLDAACGTGRHAAYLVASGREVIGVDTSEEMLARAREKLPDVDLRAGDLTALPLEDASVSGAVCALALSHLPEIGPAVCELARVVRPGGSIVISNPHPLATGILGWRAVFCDQQGQRLTVPEHPHLHSDYIDAFGAAGLLAHRLLEPGLTREQARARARPGHEDAFEDALTGLPAVIVWEARHRCAATSEPTGAPRVQEH